jgi:hypothetical protein
MKLSEGTYNKYKAGFTVDASHPIGDEEWLFDDKNSTNVKLIFQGYDANLWPMPDFSTWPETEWKQKVIQTGLQRTKDFIGEVWLDSVQIK